MAQQYPIQISIPKPCHERWDEMTPVERGWHCAHCQKTVKDFSGWSDADLYRYLSEHKEGGCGNFSSAQLNRPIQIPHQPHSRLYAMTIALGLTLVFVHGGEARAQSRPPLVQEVVVAQKGNTDTSNNQSGSISGTVLDEKKEPLIYAAVQVYQGGVLKGGALSDFDGYYLIQSLVPGRYDLVVSYLGFDTVKIDDIIVEAALETKQDCWLEYNSVVLGVYEAIPRNKQKYRKRRYRKHKNK